MRDDQTPLRIVATPPRHPVETAEEISTPWEGALGDFAQERSFRSGRDRLEW
jgi:hypothetical protein